MKVTFILPDQENYDIISKNYHIMECINSLKATLLFQPRDDRWSLYLWTVKLFISLLFQKNIMFTGGQCLLKHKYFMLLLKKFSQTIEFAYNFLAPLPEFVKNLKIHLSYISELAEETTTETPKPQTQCDYFLASMPYNASEYLSGEFIPEDKYVQLGYVRAFPEWLKFINKQATLWHATQKQEYCLFVLSTLGQRLDAYDEPPLLDLLNETLQVMKNACPDLHIIFKPHAITDMALFEELLTTLQFKNYSIDYGHPMILSKHAKFIIGNSFSNTMYDAYYLGCPVVEYASYDPGLLERIGNFSSGGRCCDYFISRDKEQLKRTLHSLIYSANSKSPHARIADIEKYFQGTPQPLFSILDQWLDK